jgi:hypothetical protein
MSSAGSKEWIRLLAGRSTILLMLLVGVDRGLAGERLAPASREEDRAPVPLPAVQLDTPAPVVLPAPFSGHALAHCRQRLWDWLTYHPLRSGSCGWPGIRCVKRPHLYEYLLPCPGPHAGTLVLHGSVQEWQSEGETLPPPRPLPSGNSTP